MCTVYIHTNTDRNLNIGRNIFRPLYQLIGQNRKFRNTRAIADRSSLTLINDSTNGNLRNR